MSETLLREPRQARSRATLDRIVRATGELLTSRTFDEITVADIVDRAGSSVGAFYARFRDKEALLDHLDERYARRTESSAAAAATAEPAPTIEAEIERLIRFLVRMHRIEPGLLRTLIVEARRQGEGRFRDRTRRMNRRIPPVMDRVLAHRARMAHPEPERAVYLGLLMVFSAIREVVLFPEGLAEFVDLDDEALVRELTDAYLRYLRIQEVR